MACEECPCACHMWDAGHAGACSCVGTTLVAHLTRSVNWLLHESVKARPPQGQDGSLWHISERLVHGLLTDPIASNQLRAALGPLYLGDSDG